MFGTKREEVMGGWRKLHNGELHNVHHILLRWSNHRGWDG